MKARAKDALNEAQETVRELAMFLVRVADRSEVSEQDELLTMAAALVKLSESDGLSRWNQHSTHTGNCVPA